MPVDANRIDAETFINSIDTGPSNTSLQAKDDSRPKRPNGEIDFAPTASAFFIRVARPDVFGEEASFLTIRTMPAVILVFEGECQFPLSLIEELGRSRILRTLYLNCLRNQRVKQCTTYRWQPERL
ncbi:hypothetical protein AVEN_209932-1 [Araneus ventricosus]|uniref:Uncharacterized protein n=1 Tax=Araneus ventricosus TaxID=182803 RepID=A0A4Y2DD80_ARAVE|nr:hypothetical protein AVEN_209932-1 [Araneus ventricosus]